MNDSNSLPQRMLRFAVTGALLAGTPGCPSDESRPTVNPAPPVASPQVSTTPSEEAEDTPPIMMNPGPEPDLTPSPTPEVVPTPPVEVRTNTGPPIDDEPEAPNKSGD